MKYDMKIIDFLPEHEMEFYNMCYQFFSSPAVCHEISLEAMQTTFQTALKGSPYMRGLMLTEQDQMIGYLLLSFTYSNEVGGMVVWVEEIYLKEPYRGQGYGKQVFRWIMRTYGEEVKRFRLEISPENEAARALYQKIGYRKLPYEQMVLEDF